MKSSWSCRHSWLLTFLAVLLLPYLAAEPLGAEEESARESIAEEMETKEVEPAGYGKETDRLILIANFEIFPTLSHLNGSGSLWGGSINALLAPTYRFNDKNFLILMYDGQYYKKWEFYSDDIGPKERTEFQRHTLTPMLRIDFGGGSRYSITPSFFHTRTYNKDIEPGGWSEGFYNYRDTGMGLDFDMRKLGFGGGEGSLKLGTQYYQRKYPNYVSLLDLADLENNLSLLNTEKDEKDYHGIIASAGYDWIKKTGFSWCADYSMLYKRLDDKRVVDLNGVLSSEKQRDYLHSLKLELWYCLDVDGRLTAGLNLNRDLKRSNQNYYDGMGTSDIRDDVPTSNYYDYGSYRISPNISYTFELLPLTTSLSYSYQKIDYTDRRAKESGGAYKNEKQYETEREIDFSLMYDLDENWKLLAQIQHIVAGSNNDDERIYRYDYEITNYSVGASFNF